MKTTELRVTLVQGLSRTGKTTLCLRYMVSDRKLSTRFVFDPLGVMASTCGLFAAETEEELVCAAEEGFCFFDSSHLFPGQREAGFAWFAEKTYELSKKLKGRKLLFVDEVWKHCSPHSIPLPLAEWVQDGAKWGCECLFATQTPTKLNGAITGQLTEAVSFRLQERNALEYAEGLGFDAQELKALQMGKFIALNLFSGGVPRGKVF